MLNLWIVMFTLLKNNEWKNDTCVIIFKKVYFTVRKSDWFWQMAVNLINRTCHTTSAIIMSTCELSESRAATSILSRVWLTGSCGKRDCITRANARQLWWRVPGWEWKCQEKGLWLGSAAHWNQRQKRHIVRNIVTSLTGCCHPAKRCQHKP